MTPNGNGRDPNRGQVEGGRPTVSVIIPLYNKEAEVERAIRSVFAQTFQDFEIVVVNDGSTDRGPEIVAGIEDPRIRIFLQENQGVSAARNRGIAEARADLIAFLDADDEWTPEFLETIMRLRASYPACSVFATGYIYRDPDGSESRPGIRGVPPEPWEGILENYFAVASRSAPPLWTSAVAVTKTAITSVGGFPVGVASGEDLLTWARLAAQSGVAYSARALAVFWRDWYGWEEPTRTPAQPDVVGQELGKLVQQVRGELAKGAKQYASLWHAMRASCYLRLGRRKEVLRETGKALWYRPFNKKAIVFALLGCLAPKFFIDAAFRFAHRGSRCPRTRLGEPRLAPMGGSRCVTLGANTKLVNHQACFQRQAPSPRNASTTRPTNGQVTPRRLLLSSILTTRLLLASSRNMHLKESGVSKSGLVAEHFRTWSMIM